MAKDGSIKYYYYLPLPFIIRKKEIPHISTSKMLLLKELLTNFHEIF
jgi:hypothetical protein